MNILYASNICSDKEFKRIYDMCNQEKPLQSIQKFNKLLCEGMAINENVELSILTSAPINRKMCKTLFWFNKKEKEKSINYTYCFMINLPIVKFITLFFSTIYNTIKWCVKFKNKEKVIIYDSFCPVIGNFSAIIGRMFNAKIIALYTDVPICMLDNIDKKSSFKILLKRIYRMLDNYSNSISSGYILLTKQMNEVVNKKNKPYVIIEGLVDTKNSNIQNIIENKYDKFTILYAGGLYKKFGIDNLVKAVEGIIKEDIQLILFGYGEMDKELKEKYKNHKKIKYKMTAPNEIVVEEEMKSTLLINPRFSNEEYTKYSFPSKNIEYMASGTPVLTTKLQGIPEEYNEYLYFIEDETEDGIRIKIEQLMKEDRNILYEKGIKAKKFVIEKKNNLIQAQIVYNFIVNL